MSRCSALVPGLSEEHSQAILALLTQNPSVEAVVLYGSRAMGRQHPGSDIDLCLQAPEMSLGELLILGAALDDLLPPWSIDLQLQHLIRHPPQGNPPSPKPERMVVNPQPGHGTRPAGPHQRLGQSATTSQPQAAATAAVLPSPPGAAD